MDEQNARDTTTFWTSFFDQGLFLLLCLDILILPALFAAQNFFTPFGNFKLETGAFLIINSMALLCAGWGSGLKRSVHAFRQPIAYLALLFFSIVSLSTLFSKAPATSFVGYGYESKTLIIFIFLCVLLFLTASHFYNSRKIRILAIIALCVFAVYALYFLGNNFNIFQSKSFPVGNVSWKSEISVVRETLRENGIRSLFGSGPNTLIYQRDLYDPLQQSLEGGEETAQNFNFFSTIFTETGFIGLLSWIMLAVTINYVSIQRLLITSRDRFLPLLVLAAIDYTFILSAIRDLNLVDLFFLFLFIGVLAGYSVNAYEKKKFIYIFQHFSKKISILLKILIFTVVILCISVFYRAVVASGIAEKAEMLLEEKQYQSAQQSFLNVIEILPYDIYYRKLALVLYEQIKNNFSTGDTKTLRALAREASEYAGIAVEKNEVDFRNWHTLAKIETLFAQLGLFEYASIHAQNGYNGALARKPRDPILNLEYAYFLYVIAHDREKALPFAKIALELEPGLKEAENLINEIKGNIR